VRPPPPPGGELVHHVSAPVTIDVNSIENQREKNDAGSAITPEEYKSALIKTCLTVSGAILFGAFLMISKGTNAGFEFFAGYLVEQSLSIDNLFVFIMLFDYFRVPLALQNRVLTWGIVGAIALRGIMIAVGVAAIQKFKTLILFFAGILLASSYNLLTEKEGEADDLNDNIVMKTTSWLFPNTSKEFDGEKFFTVKEGKKMATPLFLCLIAVELSDFVFAVDSIPAVLGVTKDPLIVYASNIFAIMALRSLYTLVAKAVSDLHYLKPAVAAVLGFVGGKMIAEYFNVHVGTGVSLGVVSSLLAGGVVASILDNRHRAKELFQMERTTTFDDGSGRTEKVRVKA